MINENLNPKVELDFLVLDLFAGAGGLSLGFESKGFRTIGYEMNADACKTYNENLVGKCHNVLLTKDMEYPNAPIIIGGPPCQPFSVGGKQEGTKDKRNGFPVFLDAVKKVKPKLFLFENVRGLLYKNKWYLDELKKEFEELGYIIEYKLVNFKEYGVPQNRERVIVVGHKGGFSFPQPADYHVTAGEALEDLLYSIPPESKFLTPSMDAYIEKYEKASKCKTPRDLHLDKPSRTLTCRNLAGSTGDMLRIKLPDGRRRRLLPKEALRLQSFPDWFEFQGNETSVFNQIGNAVPPHFSSQLAQSVKNYMLKEINLHEVKKDDYQVEQLTLFNSEVGEMLNQSKIYLDDNKCYKTFKEKPESIKNLINEALYILENIGIPFKELSSRGLERMALAFLAVLDVKKSDDWRFAKDENDNRALTTRDIIKYNNEHFGENMADSSYDDIRRKDLDLLLLAGIIVRSQPNAATNASTRGYVLSEEFTSIIRSYGEKEWGSQVEGFMGNRSSLTELLKPKRDVKKVPIKLPSGKELSFSAGEHNELQKAIIEEFLPIYGYGAEVLYLGDTAEKYSVLEKDKLNEIGFFELAHDELPDVVAYSESKNWLYLIEAVHSSGPISPQRKLKLERLLSSCKAEIVFVTAFLDRVTSRRFIVDIAWETEVWIAEDPTHLIHFNGHKFLGPFPSIAHS